MSVWELLISGWFLILGAIQVWLITKLWRAFSSTVLPSEDDSHWPPALAVLCIRGNDPFLPDCLRRLIAMDYPGYTLRIVLDSSNDPARDVVDAILGPILPPHVEVTILESRLSTCSGKVSGMLHATQRLPDGCEVVAFFDGDALVHPQCLRELTAPLRDGTAELTSGNRWYSPPDARLGSLVRYLWNGFAIPVMIATEIPWGGCMALPASIIQDPETRHRLQHAFGEDSTLATFVRSRGDRVRFVPSATLVNRETCGLRSFYNFVTRQFLTVRLGNPRWFWVLGHTVTLNVTLFFGNVAAINPSLRPAVVGYWSLIVVLSFEILLGGFLVRRVVSRRRESFQGVRLWQLLMVPVALVVTNFVNLAAGLHSLGMTKHTWRGITYRFGGDPRVLIVQEKPLRAESVAAVITLNEAV